MALRDRVSGALLCGLVVVVLSLPLTSSSSSNECSFVRSHQGEQCVYNIHLTQDDHCGGRSRGRRHFRPSYRTPETQNDYNAKISSMEKTFSVMKDQHEQRLKDLEGTVREMLGQDVSFASLVKSSAHLASGSVGEGQVEVTRGGRVDSDMLTRLHEEFDKLRAALRQKTEQLFDTEVKVNETEKMLEKSQLDVFKVSQDLLTAENQIAILERERAILKNQLKDRSYKLGVSSGRATDCEKKLGEQEEQLLTLIRSENVLTEELMTCELRMNMTQEELATLEARHKEMKSRHSRVKEVLSIRENELIDCYAAKTQTFCGFEDPNLCGFTQPNDTSDFFDWDWGRGHPSRHTGPSADHTCGTSQGHFMYTEASAKGRGKNAIIYSPLYRGLKQQCVEFYYHMHGRHIGTLNVYAKARGASLASVWRAYGNQGDIWSHARLAIPKELARAGYQIVFEGITENGYQGDMAIDDVSVSDGECATDEGTQAVLVKFNATDIVKNGKKFARNIKRLRLSRIPGRRRKKAGGK